MNLETFFEKFEQLANAPGAVAKMRELILTLAVQGKLVPQDPNDETAEAGFNSLVRSRKNSTLKRTKIDGEANAEDPLIPDSWMCVGLGELVSIRTGFAFKSADYAEHGTFILRVTNINPDGSFDTSNAVFLPEAKLDEKMRGFLLEEHELLVVMVGGSLGKIGRVTAEILPALLNQNMWRLKPYSDRLDHRFLWLILHDLNENRLQITSSTHGHLAMGTYAAAKVPFPPLAEQKRIVAKVAELMALCDRLEAQQQEREIRHKALARASLERFAEEPTPENLEYLFHKSYDIEPEDLRKVILGLAVRGKLVPQCNTNKPADDFFSEIATRKLRLQKEGKIGKEKPTEPLNPADLPFEVPKSWRWAKLGEITELITKGSSPKWQGIEYVSGPGGVLFITSENVGNYVLRKQNELKYVSKGFNEIEPRSILKRGDILMNLVGASIGRTALYDMHDGANINQAVALIRLVRETNGEFQKFLLHYLNSPSSIAYMLTSQVVSAQPNISLTDVREFPIPIPPPVEQRQIVEKIGNMDVMLDDLKCKVSKSKMISNNLLWFFTKLRI